VRAREQQAGQGEQRNRWLKQLQCPIEPGFHPDYELVAAETLAWAERLALLPDPAARIRLERADVARLGAAVYYDGYARSALQLATDFMTWLYVHDDLWVDVVQRDPEELDRDHDRLLEIIGGSHPRIGDHPLAFALHDLRVRLGGRTDQLSWFDDTVAQYISTKPWEVRNQLEGIVPDVRTYVQMRAYGGAVEPCFELGLLVRPIGLTRRLRNHAYLRTLALMAINLVCWANDIASLEKERGEGCTANLVIALRHELALDWSHATARAVKYWNDEMRSFDRLRAEVSSLTSFTREERVAVDTYVGLLSAWVRGNLDYDRVVSRFDEPLLSETRG
jgi:hypothetical protein